MGCTQSPGTMGNSQTPKYVQDPQKMGFSGIEFGVLIALLITLAHVKCY